MFKPKWQNSDSAIRLSSLPEIDNIDTLKDIAITDESTLVRKEALSMITDTDILENIYVNEEDKKIGAFLNARLNKIFSQKLMNTDNINVADALIKKINDEKVFCDLVLTLDNDKINTHILSFIKSENYLEKIASSNKGKDICCNAASKISKKSLLTKLEKSTKYTSVKKIISEKLEKLNVETTKMSRLKQKSSEPVWIKIRDKYESLCVDAENLQDDQNYKIEELNNQWDKLDEIPVQYYDILQKRFNKALDLFKDKQKKICELRKEHLLFLETSYNELELLTSDVNFFNNEEKVKKLKKQWDEKNLKNDDFKEIQEKFLNLINPFNEKVELHKTAIKDKKNEEIQKLNDISQEIEGYIENDTIIENLETVKTRCDEWKNIQTDLTKNSQALCKRFKNTSQLFFDKVKLEYQTKNWERWENFAKKTQLCEKIKELADEKDMFKVSKSLKKIKDSWFNMGPIPREKSQELWEEFASVSKELQSQVNQFFKNLKEEKVVNLEKKLALCEKAEEMLNDDISSPTANEYKKIQQEWKTVGYVPKQNEQSIYERFQLACNTFFEKLYKLYEDRKVEKEQLCQEIEKISELEVGDACDLINVLRRKWTQIGFISYKDNKILGDKFFQYINNFYDKLNADEPENLTKKENICKEIEDIVNNINEDTHFVKLQEKLKDLQDQWSTTGHVPKNNIDEINQRYKKTVESFLEKQDEFYKKIDTIRNKHLSAKQNLIEELELIVNSDDNWDILTDKVKDIQSKWKEIGSAPKQKNIKLQNKFDDLSKQFFANKQSFFKDKIKYYNDNAKKKHKLCVEIENLVGVETSDAALKKLSAESLAEELSFAIGANFIKKNSNPVNKTQQIKKIQREWKLVGRASKEEESILYKRFKTACDKFFNQKA